MRMLKFESDFNKQKLFIQIYVVRGHALIIHIYVFIIFLI